jgi:hypothetical protein
MERYIGEFGVSNTMTIFMPVESKNGLFYDWVGTFFKVAYSYEQYRTNWESRKRYLYLKRLQDKGRVKREKADGGFVYDDYKLKYSFYVENQLVVESHIAVGTSSGPHHVEINPLEGPPPW